MLFIIQPLALYFALFCFTFSVFIFLLGGALRNEKLKTRLSYSILCLLFIPDFLPHFKDQPILFLGAAFYVIRQMMTVTEGIKKRKTVFDFLASLLLATFFFASLPSGPVYNGFDAWEQFKERKAASFKEGLYRITEGFAYLFAISGFVHVAMDYLNGLSLYSDNNFALMTYTLSSILLNAILSFGFLFSTFYGYSRMAEGSALLMGFSVPENFNKPHLSRDLADFWQRWHRSMAKFVVQYIYFPLLVSYKNARLAIIAAFLFMGIWHDFTLGFILWGLGHGIALSYAVPWLNKNCSSTVLVRIISLSYVLFLSSIAHGNFIL
ncbi:MBOAT family O-acyltransferase [Glaciecola siphonariae]|uniref:MBOAT family O-acyltransferase n=1 Tax=Glaciecola siphonariae TaxID=521012 RepID=A0ABV9LUS5_9ALTE